MLKAFWPNITAAVFSTGMAVALVLTAGHAWNKGLDAAGWAAICFTFVWAAFALYFIICARVIDNYERREVGDE